MQGGSTDFREAPPPTLSTDTPKAGSAASEEAGEEQVGAGSRLTQGSDQMLAAVLTQGYQNQGQAVSGQQCPGHAGLPTRPGHDLK